MASGSGDTMAASPRCTAPDTVTHSPMWQARDSPSKSQTCTRRPKPEEAESWLQADGSPAIKGSTSATCTCLACQTNYALANVERGIFEIVIGKHDGRLQAPPIKTYNSPSAYGSPESALASQGPPTWDQDNSTQARFRRARASPLAHSSGTLLCSSICEEVGWPSWGRRLPEMQNSRPSPRHPQPPAQLSDSASTHTILLIGKAPVTTPWIVTSCPCLAKRSCLIVSGGWLGGNIPRSHTGVCLPTPCLLSQSIICSRTTPVTWNVDTNMCWTL